MTHPTNEVLNRLKDVKHRGDGWQARCPKHHDRKQSLSVSCAADGKCLLHCHAGCSTTDIVGALGMQMSDLFVPDQNRNGKPKPNSKPSIVATYDYNDAREDLVMQVVRYANKDFRQRQPDGKGGWLWSVKGCQVVPYRLHKWLEHSGTIYVVEGEKDVESLEALGLDATCNSGGAGKWKPEHSKYLMGRDVVILADNDDAGRAHARAVAQSLDGIAISVRIIELPGLEPKGDVSDWIDNHGDAAEPEIIVANLEQLVAQAELYQRDNVTDTADVEVGKVGVDETEPIEAERPKERVERFQPFPTNALPEPVQSFVVAGAKAIGCDASYLALPLLTTLAAAIGNTRCIQLKRGWSEPAILWTAIVGDSGTMKSPALEVVLSPVRDRQRRVLADHADAMKQHRDDLLRYDRDLAGWKKTKGGGEPPEKPEEPIAERYWCDDPTIEALVVLLLHQWRGLLMVRDELAGWIGSFDRYSGGKGGDVARWLEMFGGRSMVVDRKTGIPRTLFVPRAAVSVAGGIQPEILRRCLGQQYRDNGLAARLLLACPPRTPKRWTEADISPEAEASISALLDRLYSLEPTVSDDDELQPINIGLTPEAKRLWVKFYNEHAQESSELTGDLSAAWSKLEGYAARFALVIHFARWAADDPDLQTHDAVDQVSIDAGIRLSRWFGHEARRVYAILAESDDDRDVRRLVEWIEGKGGKVSPREVQMGCRWLRGSGNAEAALNALVKAGHGEWHDAPPGPNGGRPSRVFGLQTVSTSTELPGTRDSGGFVDVDNVDGPETDSDEWGEL